jgi:hypothetical protein
MYSLQFRPILVFSCALSLFLTACSSSTQPLPSCTGEDCPTPCENVTTAKVSARERKFTSTTTLKSCYLPGTSEAEVKFTVAPDQADLNAEQAIAVLDIVQRGIPDGQPVPSYTTRVFDINSFAVEPDIFSEPFDMAILRAGTEATFSFKINNDAPVGEYELVLSFFRGTRATDQSLAGRIFYSFDIER